MEIACEKTVGMREKRALRRRKDIKPFYNAHYFHIPEVEEVRSFIWHQMHVIV